MWWLHIIELFLKQIKIEYTYISFVAAVEHKHKRTQGSYTYDYYCSAEEEKKNTCTACGQNVMI